MEIEFLSAKCVQKGEEIWLGLQVKDKTLAQRICGELNGIKKFIAIFKEFTKKRSRNANAYFWELCNKLSAKIRIPPLSIYREYIKDVGENTVIIPLKSEAAKTFKKNWEHKGFGWICEYMDIDIPKDCINLMCFYGSSVYETKQMARLIDLVVEDCKAQGIETMTPDELAKLKASWNNA
jgi:hypothetical protein